jgi:epoxyqueuosine reductase
MLEWVDELLPLDEASFRERYRGTAFRRPGRDGLLRNLAVGLGNGGRAGAREALERLAADQSNLVAEHARWGLEQMQSTQE